MDDLDRMRALRQQGFFCSQILIILGLELQGRENPDLVRADARAGWRPGLYGGDLRRIDGRRVSAWPVCRQGHKPDDEDDPRLKFMMEDLVKWFKAEYGQAVWRHPLRRNPGRECAVYGRSLPRDGGGHFSKS